MIVSSSSPAFPSTSIQPLARKKVDARYSGFSSLFVAARHKSRVAQGLEAVSKGGSELSSNVVVCLPKNHKRQGKEDQCPKTKDGKEAAEKEGEEEASEE